MEVDQILEDREVTHGDFEIKAMWIQEIMEHLIGLNAYQNMEADKKEAIHMILVKLSRIFMVTMTMQIIGMILLDMLYWLQIGLKINNDFTDGFVYIKEHNFIYKLFCLDYIKE